MNQAQKTELFENTPVQKAVVRLAVPTVLSSLVTILYSLADTFFVGQLGDPTQNAAVTLAAPMMLAFYAITNLFGVGSASMMSRAMGRKDMDTAHRSAAFGFYMTIIFGALYSLASFALQKPILRMLGADATTAADTAAYLFWIITLGAVPSVLNVVLSQLVRAEGAALHAGIGTISGCLLNILLDPLFILPQGLDLGAAGAGLATFIGNSVACLYFIVLLICRRKTTVVKIHHRYFRPDKALVKGVCTVGIPASIQNLLNVTGMTVMNNFAAADANAVAAVGIAYRIAHIALQIAQGVTQAAMPVVGYCFGAKNYKRMKHTVLFTGKVTLGIMGLFTLTYLLLARPIITAFIDNAAVITYGTVFLRGMCLGQLFLGIDFLAVGVFQACGMGSRSLLFAFLRKIVLEIPALLLLNHLFPLYGLGFAQLCAEFILAITAVLMLRSIFKKLTVAA